MNYDGNPDGTAYLPLAKSGPLSREVESDLMMRWKGQGDLRARDALIRSQMRTVVSVARMYRCDPTTREELIAEGNLGLLHALSKFDPTRGTRFVTYAVPWVRTHMWAYLTRSRSLVSTGVGSKRLGRLRRELNRAPDDIRDTDTALAATLGVSVDQLRSLRERLDLRDVPLPEESETNAMRFDALSASPASGEDNLLSNENERQVQEAVAQALAVLDKRERLVVERRLMAHEDEEASLASIGRELGVSRERARQLEARAKRKIRTALGAYPPFQEAGTPVTARAA